MPSEEERAMARGNMHKKFGKVWLRGFRVMRVDKHTDR